MSKVKVAWVVCDRHTPQEVHDGKTSKFIGYQEIGCHIVFSIKMDFAWKAHFVAGGHTMEALVLMMYSSVVSCDSM